MSSGPGSALETAGGVAGGIAGGFAGAAVGSVFGPVGTVAGRWAGARLGQWGGRAAGGYLASKMNEANDKAEPKDDAKDKSKDKADENCVGDCKKKEDEKKRRDKKPDLDRWSRGKESAQSHWEKHKSEFPEYNNVDDYVQGTHDFIDNPPEGTLTKIRPNGDVIQYNPQSNTFSSSTSTGLPRTMFRPSGGQSYWSAQ